MKKILCLVLCLCLLVPALACAAKNVITAMAYDCISGVPRSADVWVRIQGYNASSNTLTMDVYAPERFRMDEVQSLRPGDAIYTQGREIQIKSVTLEAYSVTLNGDLSLWENSDRSSYTIMNESNFGCTVNYMGRISVPVTQYLSFVDNTEPDTGIQLMQPLYYNASQFLSMLERETRTGEGPGFAADNITATFDETGKLIKLTRYFVFP